MEVTTWYANGQPLPWRLAKRDEEGFMIGEVRCELFSQLLVALGEMWAREMPEPDRADLDSVRHSGMIAP